MIYVYTVHTEVIYRTTPSVLHALEAAHCLRKFKSTVSSARDPESGSFRSQTGLLLYKQIYYGGSNEPVSWNCCTLQQEKF